MEINVRKRQGTFLIEAAFTGAKSGVTALYGPSGAGKTSIIQMVAGLTQPDSGRIDINGLCLFDSDQGINLPPEKRRIGYVFQDGRLLPHLSVGANLEYGMYRTPKHKRFVKLNHVIDLLGISHLLKRKPGRLSGGEKQRVAIGRALLTSPAILLMDEPLASLDSARKSEVMPFIMRLSKEFAVPTLYVTHSMDEILNLAARIVIIENGLVPLHGYMEDVLSSKKMQNHFSEEDKGTVISAVIETPMDKYGLTQLNIGNHILKVRPIQAISGATMRIRIPSRSVAIALTRTENTSFQNIVPGKIVEIADNDETFSDIHLDIGCPLWARITRNALHDLNLKEGVNVFALIKSVDVSIGSAETIS